MAARAALIEVFHSIQGEGRFVGAPMTFVRVATCPIRCVYCDTPNSYSAGADFEVRRANDVRMESNPVHAERVVELVTEVAGGAASVVSLTGGEPLVYPDFACELGAAVRAAGWRAHLETAALDADAMALVATEFEHVSADYKLPGTLRDGDHASAHVACIEAAIAAGATVDVKLVLTDAIADAPFTSALDALVPFRESILLVLQPVTPFGDVTERVSSGRVGEFAREAERRAFDYRVIPQIHPVLGVD